MKYSDSANNTENSTPDMQLGNQVKIMQELLASRILDSKLPTSATLAAHLLENRGQQTGDLLIDPDLGGNALLQQRAGHPELIEWQNENLKEDLLFDSTANSDAVPLLDTVTFKSDSGVFKATTLFSNGIACAQQFILPDGNVISQVGGDKPSLKILNWNY